MKSLIPSLTTTLLSLAAVGSTISLPPLAPRHPVGARDDAPPVDPNPCGTIIDYVNDGYLYFEASMAFDCLKSVPFHQDVAIRFLNYVNTTIQFQSTLAYLKKPPAGYQQPAVDVLGGLETIKNNVTAGYYTNEYAFEADVQRLLFQTHDAHISLTAGAMAAFSFLAPFEISAASEDGKSLPKVWITDDILQKQQHGYNISAITKINGQDVTEFLTDLAGLNGFGNVEPHGDWNQLFTTPALNVLGDDSLFYGYITFYPGSEPLKITVENGTDYETIWVARYNNPYNTGPLTTGGDFYNYFVLNHLPASYTDTSKFNPAYTPGEGDGPVNTTTTNSWSYVTSGAYPEPDIFQPGLGVVDDGVLSGYWLHDVDAAVLSIPTFDQTGFGIGNFSETVSFFLANATEQKLTKAVIDLQQNAGGTVELAFSTFKRFFPDLDPFAGSRRRNHALGNVIGEAFTSRFDEITKDGSNDVDTVAKEWVITPRINAATGQNFTSWADYLAGPEENGDKFTLTEQYNLSSVVFDRALFDSWIPWGYTYRYPEDGNKGSRPFEAEKIVLLTDGTCSSACAIFVELFTQAGAKTIALGGLPSTGPMQAVGGNRGAALYSSDSLDTDMEFIGANNETVKAQLPEINDEGQRDQGVYTTYFGVNLRDQVRANETDPLQFKYEAADCRLFYTLSNIYNMSRLWRDAVAAFDDPTLCVEDSTGYSDTTKPPPEPIKVNTAPLNHGQADGQMQGGGGGLTGGLQDFEPVAKAGRITSCNNGETCKYASSCITVYALPCDSGDRVQTDLCLNDVPNKDYCGAGTTFKPSAYLASKSVPDFNGYFQKQGMYTGYCYPLTGGSKWGCPAVGTFATVQNKPLAQAAANKPVIGYAQGVACKPGFC